MAKKTIAQIEEEHAMQVANLRDEITDARSRLSDMRADRERESTRADRATARAATFEAALQSERETSAMLRGYIHASIPVKLADLGERMKEALGIVTTERTI